MTDTAGSNVMPPGRELDAVRLKRGSFGVLVWNTFTEQWDLGPFAVQYMSPREIDSYYAPRHVIWSAQQGAEASR